MDQGHDLAGVDAAAVPARRGPRSGFWAVPFAFLVVMAVATLPSPLYGLYRTRDHLSALTITVVFAIFAASTIAVLQRDGLFAGLSGLFLVTTLHRPSHALSGVALDLGASAPNTVPGFAILVRL